MKPNNNTISDVKNQQKQSKLVRLSYLPTSPLGQDMTQSQFLSGI